MPLVLERYTQPEIGGFARRYNVAPDQRAAVTLDGAIRALRWGLLAPWKGHGGVRPPPIRTAPQNAIALTPVLSRAKRCLVHGDGWYAKKKIGKAIHAWWIHGSAAFAGLATTNNHDGVESFMIVMQPATGFAEMLPAAADEAWLSGGEPLDVAWRSTEISRYFEDVSHDDAKCIAPLGNPAQGSLF
jgi:putative SOS response-associated peptidase YedK